MNVAALLAELLGRIAVAPPCLLGPLLFAFVALVLRIALG